MVVGCSFRFSFFIFCCFPLKINFQSVFLFTQKLHIFYGREYILAAYTHSCIHSFSIVFVLCKQKIREREKNASAQHYVQSTCHILINSMLVVAFFAFGVCCISKMEQKTETVPVSCENIVTENEFDVGTRTPVASQSARKSGRFSYSLFIMVVSMKLVRQVQNLKKKNFWAENVNIGNTVDLRVFGQNFFFVRYQCNWCGIAWIS